MFPFLSIRIGVQKGRALRDTRFSPSKPAIRSREQDIVGRARRSRLPCILISHFIHRKIPGKGTNNLHSWPGTAEWGDNGGKLESRIRNPKLGTSVLRSAVGRLRRSSVHDELGSLELRRGRGRQGGSGPVELHPLQLGANRADVPEQQVVCLQSDDR